MKIEFEELIVLDAPIAITGFSSDEIDQVILEIGGPALETGPLEPPPEAKAVTRSGNVWLLGSTI